MTMNTDTKRRLKIVIALAIAFVLLTAYWIWPIWLLIAATVLTLALLFALVFFGFTVTYWVRFGEWDWFAVNRLY